jgi:hypothetical protein
MKNRKDRQPELYVGSVGYTVVGVPGEIEIWRPLSLTTNLVYGK